MCCLFTLLILFHTEVNLGHLKQLKWIFLLSATIDDSQLLTAVIKNFGPDATGVLDPRDRN